MESSQSFFLKVNNLSIFSCSLPFSDVYETRWVTYYGESSLGTVVEGKKKKQHKGFLIIFLPSLYCFLLEPSLSEDITFLRSLLNSCPT